MADTFTIGKTYYTQRGQKVELLAMTKDDRFVVAELFEAEGFEGTETVWGPTVFVSTLFTTAPRALVDADIAKLHEEVQKLEAMRDERLSAVLKLERETRDRLEALKKYDGLELLEEFIAGKITHFVCESYNDWEIKTFSEFDAHDDYGRGLGTRLIALFGNSKGQLTWRVSEYRDGSGARWNRVIPCSSEEDAIIKRQEIVAAAVENNFKFFKSDSPYYFLKTVDLAHKYNVPVSDEIEAIFKAHRRAELERARDEATKTATQATERLAALEQKIAEV